MNPAGVISMREEKPSVFLWMCNFSLKSGRMRPPAEENLSVLSFYLRMIPPSQLALSHDCGIRCMTWKVLLTTQFDANEVFDAQVFQENPRGWGGFEQEGDVGAQLPVERGEVEVRRLLVKKRCVPHVFCTQCKSICGAVSKVYHWALTPAMSFSSARTFGCTLLLVMMKLTLDLLSPWQRRCPSL